ncbi:MAG: HK97 family phage prohead protease [Deltaproteobacteria bacterium]|nr:HK97 family phage prohead protease [Deltaproteobacteria bacterium]
MKALKKERRVCKKYLHFEGKVKASKSDAGPILIEGFANRFSRDNKELVDRGGDLIPPDAWLLDEFKSLPIIFFNHDRNQPIGKATMINPTKEGLFIRVKISESDHPEIKRIRDLVREGILKAFSVGFDPIKEETKEVDGGSVNIITEANLLEVSVVSLPMAQQSLFEVTTKSLADMPYQKAIDLLTYKQKDEDEEESQEETEEDEKDTDEDDQEQDDEAKIFDEDEDDDTDSESKEEDEEESEDKQDPFQDCVSRKIRKLRGEGVKPDEAVARAIAACREEDGKCCEFNYDQLKEAYDLANSISEEKQDVAMQISAVGDGDHSTDFGNPHLDTAKQTNVLLGQLIREIQMLNQRMEGIQQMNHEEGGENIDPNRMEDNIKNETMSPSIETEKMKLIDLYARECESILRKVGC